ncbi:MAG: DUF1476 domain-containing protein [Geminicoccaceae bacterium]|nr:MAG: DUF1476 domain-containing protein [Geminicoccaceae bacterium]
MTGFEDRLQGELARFHHDQEVAFRIRLRRDKLFGLKIAKLLGLGDAEAADYAKEIVVVDMSEAGDDVILRKVTSDLEAKGLPVDLEGLKRDLTKLQKEAHDQVMHE